MRIILETLGCKLNQAETESLARQFIQAGYEIVERHAPADVYILNTCTVTHTADAKSRHLLRLAQKRNPHAVIIVTGCYAERVAAELKTNAGIDFVVGNAEKENLLWILQSLPQANSTEKNGTTSSNQFRTRAFVKIQDGCHNFCAYCIVPFVRGKESSVSPKRIVSEIEGRTVEGYQEVVLTGTRVGGYQYEGIDLKGLLERILSETTIPRIRLSSLQPQEISVELISLWENKRLCPHFHLSLQSGSDTVLKRMNRRYTTADYQRVISLIRSIAPAVAITTDVIVGFPGETNEEFEESFEFCRQMGFARIHVFSYSPRSGTEAAKMPGQVPAKVKKERSKKMLTLAQDSAGKFKGQFSGELLDVLWEKQTDDGDWIGITGNYIRVSTKSDKDLSNKLLLAKLE